MTPEWAGDDVDPVNLNQLAADLGAAARHQLERTIMTFATEPTTEMPEEHPSLTYRNALEDILASIHQHLRQYPTADETPDYPWGEEPEALEDQDIELLWAWLIEAERASAAARILRARIEAVMLVDIKRNGAVKLGDLLYRPTPKTGKKWAFEGASRRFLEYLLTVDPRRRKPSKATTAAVEEAILIIDAAVRIDPGNVRTTYLDALSARRALADAAWAKEDPPTKEEITASQYAVRDTFIARDRDTANGYSLSKVPAKRQPKWALRMTHGERKQI